MCEYYSREKLSRERIVILSVSQAALQAISSIEIKSTKELEFIRILNMIVTENNILLSWIPGHRDSSGNELADLLAKKAVATSTWASPGASGRFLYKRV